MKTITTTICLLAAGCLIAAAEGKPDKPHRKGPPPELKEKFDKDGDGKLSEEERKAMHEAMEQRHLDKFKEFDADGDGKLSEDEREKMREARKAEMLKKYDADGNGELSDEEKAKMKEDFKGRGPKGERGPKGPNGEGKGPKGPPPPVE